MTEVWPRISLAASMPYFWRISVAALCLNWLGVHFGTPAFAHAALDGLAESFVAEVIPEALRRLPLRPLPRRTVLVLAVRKGSLERLAGAEQVRVGGSIEPGLEEGLDLGAERDDPFDVQVFGFVRVWPVDPDVPVLYDVARPHDRDLVRAHTRQAFHLDHSGEVRRGDQHHGLDVFVGHGPDLLVFLDAGVPAFGYVPNCNQGLVDRHRHQLLGDGPAEHALDHRDLLVDVAPADPAAACQPVADDLVADQLERFSARSRRPAWFRRACGSGAARP